MIGSTHDPSTCPKCGRAALAPGEPMLCDVHQEVGLESCPDAMKCSHCGFRVCGPLAQALRGGDEALAMARRALGKVKVS